MRKGGRDVALQKKTKIKWLCEMDGVTSLSAERCMLRRKSCGANDDVLYILEAFFSVSIFTDDSLDVQSH